MSKSQIQVCGNSKKAEYEEKPQIQTKKQIQHVWRFKKGISTTRLQHTYLEYSLQSDRCVHSVQFKNTLTQITVTCFELFLAQQNVQKAKLAKCISTVLHCTHHHCTEIQYKFSVWMWYWLGCSDFWAWVCFCACVPVQSDSLEFMGDERGS